MLPSADGLPMICSAVANLDVNPDDIIVTLLREHEERFGAVEGLDAAFGRPIKTCVLERPTSSQSETVAETLRALQLDEPFLVKDSDGSFVLHEADASTNYVCVQSLHHCDQMNPRNKSYVQVDDADRVTAIREKRVISDLFNVGGYFFLSPQQFLQYYERSAADGTTTTRELYLSNVIAAMLADGISFRARQITDYHDWGTLHDWRRERGATTTLFVALDGFVFERGSPFFRPHFSDVKAHMPVIEALRALIDQGTNVVYLSIRSASWKHVTQQQLAASGLPPGPIFFDCPTTKWLFVGSPHAAVSFRSTESCELEPDRPRLLEILRNMLYGES